MFMKKYPITLIFLCISLLYLSSVFAYSNSVIVSYDAFSIPVQHSVAIDASRASSCFFNETTGENECKDAFTSIEFISVIEWILLPSDTISSVLINDIPIVGDSFNVFNDSVAVWSIPVGDRDFSLFPSCRGYELEKGVCRVEELP